MCVNVIRIRTIQGTNYSTGTIFHFKVGFFLLPMARHTHNILKTSSIQQKGKSLKVQIKIELTKKYLCRGVDLVTPDWTHEKDISYTTKLIENLVIAN